jgi:hypothetical protein
MKSIMHYRNTILLFFDVTDQQPGGDPKVAEGDGGEADDGD